MGTTKELILDLSSYILFFVCLVIPTSMVGKLMIKLNVPANFTSIPNIRINMGIITSPPATPKRLRIIPISIPQNTATISYIYKLPNIIPIEPNVMKFSLIRSNPIVKSSVKSMYLFLKLFLVYLVMILGKFRYLKRKTY